MLPTHDVGPWLADSLQSLIKQTFTGWHAFIVLDGCTDESEKIAREFAGRDARFSVHDTISRGVGHARNWGFTLGSAPYVAFIDPDDLVPAEALSALITSLEQSASDMATGHAVQFRDPANKWPYWTMQSGLFSKAAPATTLAEEPRLILDHTTWNKVFRRAFLTGHNIRFPENVAIGEDARHSIEAICAAKSIDVIPATVYCHRVRPRSLTSVIRNTSSITEWVTMTRGIEAIVRSVDNAAVTATWLERMLKSEAWTRARQVGGMQSDGSLESLLALLRDLIADVPAPTWDSFPLFIRWAYEVLGLTNHIPDDARSTLQAELNFCAAQLGYETALPEFDRFERDLRVSGTELRARIWRESLLMPFLRLVDRLDPTERRLGNARVLTFQDRFVARHMLLPGEKQLLELAQGEDYGALARWAKKHRQIDGVAKIHRVQSGQLSMSAELRTPELDEFREVFTLIAISHGKIAGLSYELDIQMLDASPIPGKKSATITTPVLALKPFGRWEVGALTCAPDEAPHFIPLQLVDSGSNRIPSALRTVLPVSAIGQSLIVESKPPALQRALARACRHRISRGIRRRWYAVLSRYGLRARRS